MIKLKLDKRYAEKRPIKIGWVGAGRIITGAICQTALMKGMFNSIICDIRIEAAIRAYNINGYKRDDMVVTNDVSEANDAIQQSKPVVTENYEILPELNIDAVVEGTGVPEVGAQVAYRCIQAGKNIIMLNVETDVIVGPILYHMAKRAGVIYSVSSGDEPGLITELVDRWGGLGFEIVAVGKSPTSLGKMDKYATPDTVAEDAIALNINPHFLVTFRDTTKTAIEMTSISNATGLVPDIRGMHGPVAGIKDMAKLFCPKEEGGILNKRGVVDYARPLLLPGGTVDFVNSVTPGVFVIIRTIHPQIQQDLDYWNVIRSGDYFTFYTPYHIATNEIPLSIVWAVEDHEATVIPHYGHLTEVIGAAKADFKAGTIIDGGGGFTVYAQNDLAKVAKEENCVPFGLLEGAKLIKDVKKDQVITYEMVELKKNMLYYLRKLQEEIISPVSVKF